MNFRHLQLASGFFLITALVCMIIDLRPPENGVRIPVHCANGKIGYIDSNGKMAIDADWNTATPFGPDGHALVSVQHEMTKTRMFFLRWFPRLRLFGMAGSEHYRIDRFGNKTTYVPASLNLLDQPKEPFRSDEMSLIEQGSEFRWILKDGGPAFPGTWQKVADFKAEDSAAVFKDGRWGFIDRSGKAVIPFQWDDTHGFNGNGRACVAVNRKWGVIDREGQLVVPLYFISLAGFDEKEMCSAKLASGCGFIDRNGKILITFRYRNAGNFDRFDMAKIEIADSHGAVHCGWINRSGETLVQPIYQLDSPQWASNFTDHELLPVIGPKGAGLIDRQGGTILATANGELQPIGDSMVPGTFWIRTAPHRSATPQPGSYRNPFEPSCYDQTGKLIWHDDILASLSAYNILATISGLVSALLFSIAKLLHRAEIKMSGT